MANADVSIDKRGVLLRFLPWGALAALILFVIWPLVRPGFIPTHDGEYHMIRFWQFSRMIEAGYLIPRWAPDLNSGYGLPLFNFQYPFPNYVGALWHAIGFSLSNSLKLTLATGYAGAVAFCFLWLSALFPPFAAWSATAVFMFTPYWFVNLYVRGSVGEVLSMAWVMMTLWALERGRKIIVASGIAFLILTHNISAMIFLPIILLYAIVRKKDIRIWAMLGVALAAYFWLPALFESRLMTGLNSIDYRNYFPEIFQLIIPSWGTGFAGSVGDNALSPQIGIVPIVLILFSLIKCRNGKEKTFWLVLAGCAMFLMLSASRFLWSFIPLLPLVQFPWRFLAVVMLAGTALSACLFRAIPKALAMCFVIASMALTYAYVRPVTYAARNDTYYLSRPNFTDGTSSLGNALSTVWTGWKSGRPAWPAEVLSGNANLTDMTREAGSVMLTAEADKTAILRLNVLYFPGWQVTVDGKQVSYSQKDGVIELPVPAGKHRIEAHFGESPVRAVSDVVSFTAAAYMFIYFLARRNAAKVPLFSA